MTVAELIKELQTWPPGDRVMVAGRKELLSDCNDVNYDCQYRAVVLR